MYLGSEPVNPPHTVLGWTLWGSWFVIGVLSVGTWWEQHGRGFRGRRRTVARKWEQQ